MTQPTSPARVLFLALCLSGAGAVFAQAPQPPQGEPDPVARRAPQPTEAPPVQQPVLPPTPIAALQNSPDARETRQQLDELLRQYPPSVAQVFRLDPSLLTRPDYMAVYPGLAVFLQQHPDIVRDPSFFFGQGLIGGRDARDPSTRAVDVFGEVLFEAMVFSGLMALLGVLAWLLRQLVDHRRWLRMSRVQTEVHTKLLDRLTSNEDLLGYIQSPAGRRFLESAPVSVEGDSRPIGAPVARILWSVQAGVVLVLLGCGLWVIQHSALEELAQGFYFLSVVTMALGIGFIASAAMSYFLSVRLGLFAPPKPYANG